MLDALARTACLVACTRVLVACGVDASEHDAIVDVGVRDIEHEEDGLDGQFVGRSDASDGGHDDLETAPDGTPPSFDSLPWQVVGTGVSFRDAQNPVGENVFIGYAGYGVADDAARAWVSALYDAWLRDRGVRYVFAVRGPADVTYASQEIGNSRLIATLLPALSSRTHFIAVAAHSSGAYVACELFSQLFETGLDPMHLTEGRTVYFDLDGAEGCLDRTIVSSLRRAYFVSARTRAGAGGGSLNATWMMAGATMWGSGGSQTYDATGSGCDPNAPLCLHVALINTVPHDPSNADTQLDYADFAARPVNTWYLSTFAADLPP